MTQKRGRKQSPTPTRHARPGSEYGLVSRVAEKLGKSKSLVSAVKNGFATSAKVAAAIEAERELMRKEQQPQRTARKGAA